MTIRNLDAMLKPASIVLVVDTDGSPPSEAVVVSNLFRAGFQGKIYTVGSACSAAACRGEVCSDIDSLPRTPDLAVLVSPPGSVPRRIGELGARGVKAAVVITPGHFGKRETEPGLRSAMLEAAKPHLLRILGPGSMGLMVPGVGLNASISHLQALPGDLALVSQSTTVATAVIENATSKGIGFSHIVSLGETADVDFGDMLDYLGSEFRTKAVVLCVESISGARKFLSAARAAARVKPVVVIKPGRHLEDVHGSNLRTGEGLRLMEDAVYDAAFSRTGMLRVYNLEELFSAVTTLVMVRPFSGDRLVILANGCGIGALAADALVDEGGRLPELSPETVARLAPLLPAGSPVQNPVNLGADADAKRYAEALEAILDAGKSDGVLVSHSPSAFAAGSEAAEAVIGALGKAGARGKARPIFTSWLGEGTVSEPLRLFKESRIPTYETPAAAVRGFMQMVRYRRHQDLLMETPPTTPDDFVPDTMKAKSVIHAALDQGRSWLSEAESRAVLSAYRIPVMEARTAATAEDAAEIAAQLGGPVVLKILSPDVNPSYRFRLCGAVREIVRPEAVRDAATAMAEQVRKALPDAVLQGFTVQPMIRFPSSHELAVSMVGDTRFGPVILFGPGGAAAELNRDRAAALPPLNKPLARELISRFPRIRRMLVGSPGVPGSDLDGVALTLVGVSQLVCDMAQVTEIDINPLLAGPWGVTALDVRIGVSPTDVAPGAHTAIRPYPRELEEIISTPDGQNLLLRPVRPEDEPAYQRLFQSLPPEDVRLRFLHPMRMLSHELAARLTQIDYDREMALVLTGKGPAGETELHGGVRIHADPDNERAEFAIVMRREMTGMGLGPMLLRRIIEYARRRGVKKITGDVLAENTPMLRLCKAFGFAVNRDPDDPGTLTVSLNLQ